MFEGRVGRRKRPMLLRGAAPIALALAACALAVASPVSAKSRKAPPAAPPPAPTIVDFAREAGGDYYTFYAGRDYRPVWLDASARTLPAGDALLRLIETAVLDGIDPGSDPAALRAQIGAAAAAPTPLATGRADLALSRAFAGYVAATLAATNETIYEHDILRPQPVRPYHLLAKVAADPAGADYVSQMQWMHPLYAPLRQRLEATSDPRQRSAGIATLARIRAIPRMQRQILVDVAAARLWMYEDGRPVDSMRVVVGRNDTRTPLLAGFIRDAIVNPYWNVPDTLITRTIAPNVLRQGFGYLKLREYEVLSRWGDGATPVDPGTVDWKAAARGEHDLRIRQQPRPGNAMGQVKYEFPNNYGIYLHDTPDKHLMLKPDRQFSNGCIRLEDAARLGRWLLQGSDLPTSGQPETRVPLPSAVPIYLTYLTAHPDGTGLALVADPYGLDATQRLAATAPATTAPSPLTPAAMAPAPASGSR